MKRNVPGTSKWLKDKWHVGLGALMDDRRKRSGFWTLTAVCVRAQIRSLPLNSVINLHQGRNKRWHVLGVFCLCCLPAQHRKLCHIHHRHRSPANTLELVAVVSLLHTASQGCSLLHLIVSVCYVQRDLSRMLSKGRRSQWCKKVDRTHFLTSNYSVRKCVNSLIK